MLALVGRHGVDSPHTLRSAEAAITFECDEPDAHSEPRRPTQLPGFSTASSSHFEHRVNVPRGRASHTSAHSFISSQR